MFSANAIHHFYSPPTPTPPPSRIGTAAVRILIYGLIPGPDQMITKTKTFSPMFRTKWFFFHWTVCSGWQRVTLKSAEIKSFECTFDLWPFGLLVTGRFTVTDRMKNAATSILNDKNYIFIMCCANDQQLIFVIWFGYLETNCIRTCAKRFTSKAILFLIRHFFGPINYGLVNCWRVPS